MIAPLAYQLSYWYLKPFMNYRGFKRWKSDTYTHAHTHTRILAHTHTRAYTHTSGRQLKIGFLDFLDYSNYSDTNIAKRKIFHENIASSVRKQESVTFIIEILIWKNAKGFFVKIIFFIKILIKFNKKKYFT